MVEMSCASSERTTASPPLISGIRTPPPLCGARTDARFGVLDRPTFRPVARSGGNYSQTVREIKFIADPIRVDAYNGMTKNAALRLAWYLRAIGHRVSIKRHRLPGGAIYTISLVEPLRRPLVRRARRG
jgi:hypothetical protein